MSWSEPGNACPKCGSADTDLKDFQEAVYDTDPDGNRFRTTDSRYEMICVACGHTELVVGNPYRGRGYDDEEVDSNPDVGLAKTAAAAEIQGFDLGDPLPPFIEPIRELKSKGIHTKVTGAFKAYAVVGPDDYREVDITDIIKAYVLKELDSEEFISTVREKIGK